MYVNKQLKYILTSNHNMPTRYTFEQVVAIFESRQCKLLDTEYTNQRQKLKYVAKCGHTHSIDLKMFLGGTGTNCRPCAFDIPTFGSVSTALSNKGCTISMTEEEFISCYKTNKTKINYIASCGHQNSVSWKNFVSLNQGINCPSCVSKNTGIKLKELRSGDKNNSSIEQEFACIKYFIELVKDQFQVKKTFDGCKADIILRPCNNIEDLWIGIQVKTTCKKTDRGQYDFRLNSSKYDNYIILCICLEDKKMWIIPYEDIKEVSATIKISLKSKYNCYEVTIDNIHTKLMEYYTNIPKFQFDTLNIPTSDTHKQELYYRKIREEKVKSLTFEYPDFEGTVYDFTVSDKKVQEKVGLICRDNPNSFGFNLNKSAGKHENCSYKSGDNDVYWLHCKNSNKFYVIPESILIEHGFIGDNCRQHLYVSPTNERTKWTEQYLFNYDNVDEERLFDLFQ